MHPPHPWQALSKTNLLYLHCIALGASLTGNIFHNLQYGLYASTLQPSTLTICLPSRATFLHQQILEAAIRSQTLFRAPGEQRLHLQLPLLHSQRDKCYHPVRSATAASCGPITKVSLGIGYQWLKNTFEEEMKNGAVGFVWRLAKLHCGSRSPNLDTGLVFSITE